MSRAFSSGPERDRRDQVFLAPAEPAQPFAALAPKGRKTVSLSLRGQRGAS
jgi:hypothetical protein